MATYSKITDFVLNGLDAQMIFDRLPVALGGGKPDYRLEWGGDVPGLIRVTTEREGVTQAQLQDVVDGHRALTLNAAPNPFTADNVAECVITSAPLTEFTWDILRNGQVVLSGSNVGDASVDFSTDTPGTYTVALRNGNNSGIVEVVANEG